MGLLAVLFTALPVRAHTLPISYLRLVPTEQFLHLELVFNPFELTFMGEVDTNRDAELDAAELAAHGQTVADRVVAALRLRAGERVLQPENAGMDPELAGHHVRLRAHYRADARGLPLTVESRLPLLTSAAHLTQVTYVNGDHTQLAQLDAQSRAATFAPPTNAAPADPARQPPRRRFALAVLLLGATGLLVLIGGALWWSLRKQLVR